MCIDDLTSRCNGIMRNVAHLQAGATEDAGGMLEEDLGLPVARGWPLVNKVKTLVARLARCAPSAVVLEEEIAGT